MSVLNFELLSFMVFLTRCSGSCEFDKWCPWSECTKPCNGGTMTRSRDCPCGNCEGDTYEVKDCNTECCRKLTSNLQI